MRETSTCTEYRMSSSQCVCLILFLPRTPQILPLFLSAFTVALYSVGIGAGLSVIHYVDTQRNVNDIRKTYT